MEFNLKSEFSHLDSNFKRSSFLHKPPENPVKLPSLPRTL